MKKRLIFIAALLALLLLAACGSKNGNTKKSTLDGLAKSDMSGYEGLSGYDKELRFVDATVKDVLKMMDNGESFALFMSFPKCPWCNAVVKYINDAAAKADMLITNINTRKDPSWTSNFDLTDYDLFAERFGEYLSDSEKGKRLYVPHAFFIKDGKVVYEHQGAIPVMGNDPNYKLNDAEQKELTDVFKAGFEAIK